MKYEDISRLETVPDLMAATWQQHDTYPQRRVRYKPYQRSKFIDALVWLSIILLILALVADLLLIGLGSIQVR